MNLGEVLFGLYGLAALTSWMLVFLKLLADRGELSAFTFFEKTAFVFIWFVLSGAMSMCWPVVLAVAITPRFSQQRY